MCKIFFCLFGHLPMKVKEKLVSIFGLFHNLHNHGVNSVHAHLLFLLCSTGNNVMFAFYNRL